MVALWNPLLSPLASRVTRELDLPESSRKQGPWEGPSPSVGEPSLTEPLGPHPCQAEGGHSVVVGSEGGVPGLAHATLGKEGGVEGLGRLLWPLVDTCHAGGDHRS